MASTQTYLKIASTNPQPRPQRFSASQIYLPEEAKEQDRIRASSTKTKAFPSQILFQNLTAFNLVETQIGYKPNSPRTAELEVLRGTCSIYFANFKRILSIYADSP